MQPFHHSIQHARRPRGQTPIFCRCCYPESCLSPFPNNSVFTLTSARNLQASTSHWRGPRNLTIAWVLLHPYVPAKSCGCLNWYAASHQLVQLAWHQLSNGLVASGICSDAYCLHDAWARNGRSQKQIGRCRVCTTAWSAAACWIFCTG